jgi:hypothetical protein
LRREDQAAIAASAAGKPNGKRNRGVLLKFGIFSRFPVLRVPDEDFRYSSGPFPGRVG